MPAHEKGAKSTVLQATIRFPIGSPHPKVTWQDVIMNGLYMAPKNLAKQ